MMKHYVVKINLKGIGTAAHAVSADSETEAIKKALANDVYALETAKYYLDSIEVIEV